MWHAYIPRGVIIDSISKIHPALCLSLLLNITIWTILWCSCYSKDITYFQLMLMTVLTCFGSLWHAIHVRIRQNNRCIFSFSNTIVQTFSLSSFSSSTWPQIYLLKIFSPCPKLMVLSLQNAVEICENNTISAMSWYDFKGKCYSCFAVAVTANHHQLVKICWMTNKTTRQVHNSWWL